MQRPVFPGKKKRPAKVAQKASREVFTGKGSFVAFARGVAEKLGPAKQSRGVTGKEAQKLIGARNWSSLDPRARRELMARSIRENAESRLSDRLKERIKTDVKEKLRAKGVKAPAGLRPSLPAKPAARLPKPAPAAPRPKKRGPLGRRPKSRVPSKSPALPPPLGVSPPRAPQPVPRQSQPVPAKLPPEEPRPPFKSDIGYFVSLSKIGYYTVEPPVRLDNPLVYDFAGEPDGILSLSPGQTWTSPWYEGEILRGMSVDAVGDWRLNYISNGSFER